MTQTRKADARSAHWQHHINAWQSSDLSGADYCRQHQLAYHCFVYWRRKFANTTEQQVPMDSDTQARSAFVTVQPQPITSVTAVNGADLHLRLPNGLEIRNIYNHNLGNVCSLLACLS